MIHDDIYILSAYDNESSYGDIIKVTPNQFKLSYLEQEYPKYVMIPVVEDPSGVIQYVKVNADRLIHTFKSCKVTYQLRVEYYYDEEIDPIILPEVELEIHDMIELYQVFWNITRFTAIFNIMNDANSMWVPSTVHTSLPGATVLNDHSVRIIDIASYKLDIEGSNKGDIHFNFDMHDRKTGGRYLFSEVLARDLQSVMHSIDDDYDSLLLGGSIFVDDAFENWAVTESGDEVHADGEYFYPIASGAYILSSAVDFKYLSKSVYSNGYTSSIDVGIRVTDRSERDWSSDINSDDMVGKYHRDRGLLDRFLVHNIDLSLLMEVLTDIHYIAQCLVLYETAVNPYLNMNDIWIDFEISGPLSLRHSIICEISTDNDFPTNSALVRYLEAIDKAFD